MWSFAGYVKRKKDRQRGKCLPAEAHANCNLLFNYEWQNTWRQRAEAGPYLRVCVWKQHLQNTLVFVSLCRGEQTGSNKDFFFLCLLHSSECHHNVMCRRVRQDGSFIASAEVSICLAGISKEETMWHTHSQRTLCTAAPPWTLVRQACLLLFINLHLNSRV